MGRTGSARLTDLRLQIVRQAQHYGVEPNFVETAIIPSTWREGGVQLVGNFDNGLTLQGGLSTSLDLTKWDAASSEGRESPLGTIHQELALAKSHDLAVFGAINWRGIPGLLLGGSIRGRCRDGRADREPSARRPGDPGA